MIDRAPLTVPCFYCGCALRRDENGKLANPGGHQQVPVPADYDGSPVYCSLQCSTYDRLA